ncbi:MAG: hypothetical protein Ct9H300mP25_03540 [Acidobacteriota bacterium]|nr:MAG: hypothetical protein Ct9H300mP25_03540 [Acidobacteriota bacterium]
MGKVWVFGAAIDQGFIWLAVIGVVNSAISLYYYYRIIVFMWLKEETLGSDIEMSPGDSNGAGHCRCWVDIFRYFS